MDSTMLLSVRKTVILSAVALAMAFTGAATVRPCLNCLNLTLPDGQIQAAPTQTPDPDTTPAASGAGFFQHLVQPFKFFRHLGPVEYSPDYP